MFVDDKHADIDQELFITGFVPFHREIFARLFFPAADITTLGTVYVQALAGRGTGGTRVTRNRPAAFGKGRQQAFRADNDGFDFSRQAAISGRLCDATDFIKFAEQTARHGDGELIAETYRGIRPAPGYPACPDHSVKRAMFALLQADDIGMGLTESLAMTPAASVSGFYLSHPDSTYFNVGKLGEDQVRDLAQRSGVAEGELKRWLGTNL